MVTKFRILPGNEDRFALLKVDSEQLSLMLAAGWQPVIETDDGKRVIVWWPCQCDPPPLEKRTASPAPPDRGEND